MSAIYFEMFKIYTLQGMVNYSHNKNPYFTGDDCKCLYYLYFSGQLDLFANQRIECQKISLVKTVGYNQNDC